MCNEQAELFDVFGRIASFLGEGGEGGSMVQGCVGRRW